jgi:predicted AAA+ superfamily ATPase
LEKYIEYLKSSYLFSILYKDHKSIIKQGRIQKKIYTTSTNFICSLNKYNAGHFDERPEVFGKIIENVIYTSLSAKNNDLFFWRDGTKEIDFLIRKDKSIIPVEVKFGENPVFSDLKHLLYYCKKNEIKKSIVITRAMADKKEVNDILFYYIPYYFFLF